VPAHWDEWAAAWLQGFDGDPATGEVKPVSDMIEAELDDAGISEPSETATHQEA